MSKIKYGKSLFKGGAASLNSEHSNVRYASGSQASVEFSNAKPFEEIPQPPTVPFLGHANYFMGKIILTFLFTGIVIFKLLPDKRMSLDSFEHFHNPWREKYGNLIRMRLPFQRPMLLSYDPDDFKTVYSSDGKYPINPTFENMGYFRKNFKKDKFPKSGKFVPENIERQR